MSVLETVLAAYGVSKGPSLPKARGSLSCASKDRARFERDLRKSATAKVEEDMKGSAWREQRAQWRRDLAQRGFTGSAADAEVRRREGLARDKAIEAEVRARTAEEVDRRCDELADEDAVRPAFMVSREERQFLKAHARVLRMGATDRARSSVRVLFRLYWRSHILIKMLVWMCVAFFVLLVLPGLVWMGYKVLSSKMAMAKMVIMCFFTMALLMLGAMLKP